MATFSGQASIKVHAESLLPSGRASYCAEQMSELGSIEVPDHLDRHLLSLKTLLLLDIVNVPSTQYARNHGTDQKAQQEVVKIHHGTWPFPICLCSPSTSSLDFAVSAQKI